MFFVHADLAKSMLTTKRATGLVEKKDARQQFPHPQPFCFTDESGEQQITHSSTSPIAMDVHREFADAPITFPVPVRSGAGPADNFTVDLRDHSRITTSDGLKPRPLVFRRSPLGFIRGNAVIDPLIVNLSNGRGIVQVRVPNA